MAHKKTSLFEEWDEFRASTGVATQEQLQAKYAKLNDTSFTGRQRRNLLDDHEKFISTEKNYKTQRNALDERRKNL